MEEHQSTVMTIDEVAEYLKIARSSVYKIAQEGRIPCRKVEIRWRFHRQAIDNWLGNSQPANKKPEE